MKHLSLYNKRFNVGLSNGNIDSKQNKKLTICSIGINLFLDMLVMLFSSSIVIFHVMPCYMWYILSDSITCMTSTSNYMGKKVREKILAFTLLHRHAIQLVRFNHLVKPLLVIIWGEYRGENNCIQWGKTSRFALTSFQPQLLGNINIALSSCFIVRWYHSQATDRWLGPSVDYNRR